MIRGSARSFGLLMTILLLSSAVVFGETLTFTTTDGDDRNVVMFESNAPLEKVVGRTHDLTATLTFDPRDLTQKVTGRFSVDLSTLDTGLQLRNQHMRENHLRTDQYPHAVFTLTGIKSGSVTSLTEGETVSLVVDGELDLHGVKKSYRVPGELTYTRENGKHVLNGRASWGISLQEHDIHRPRYLFMKLAEEQIASIKFVMTASE